QKAKHVCAPDLAHAFLLLQTLNAAPKLFHLGPMHLRTEMVFGVIAVVEEQPVIDFAVAAHPPGNRFVRIRAVVAVIAIQITETVSQVPERQEKKYEPP